MSPQDEAGSGEHYDLYIFPPRISVRTQQENMGFPRSATPLARFSAQIRAAALRISTEIPA